MPDLIFDILKNGMSAEDRESVGQYVMLKDEEVKHEVIDRSQHVEFTLCYAECGSLSSARSSEAFDHCAVVSKLFA